MKEVLICYFSGTGNTKKVVDCYAQSFEKLGLKTTLHNIDDGDFEGDISAYDYFGIAYPIHAFNAPANVLNFAKKVEKLQKNAKKPYFIIKTSGEPLKLNNISSLKLDAIMKKKGYNLTNEYHYCMPYNIIFRHTDNMAYNMWQTAQKLAPIDSKEIVDGKDVKLSFVPFGKALAWAMRIEHWGGRFNGRQYKVGDECLKCGLCLKQCPVKNIKYQDGQFKFGKECLMCMRCSFNCPTNAIKIGLFNSWKVNGAYNFDNFDENETQTHQRYCKKSYQKYFKRGQEKIENAQKENNTYGENLSENLNENNENL